MSFTKGEVFRIFCSRLSLQIAEILDSVSDLCEEDKKLFYDVANYFERNLKK